MSSPSKVDRKQDETILLISSTSRSGLKTGATEKSRQSERNDVNNELNDRRQSE
jgi:hypothetical protein